MFNKIFLLSLFILITGCSTHNYKDDRYGQLNIEINEYSTEIATFAQWNENYAVTVKHASNVPNSVYQSDIYDLQFFKKKSVGNIPEWSYSNEKDIVSMIGYTEVNSDNKIIKKGKDLGTADFLIKNKYRMVDTTIIKGMSGGPVINNKNKLVGINIGYTHNPVFIKDKEIIVSVFLSYEAIQEEWLKFEKNI